MDAEGDPRWTPQDGKNDRLPQEMKPASALERTRGKQKGG